MFNFLDQDFLIHNSLYMYFIKMSKLQVSLSLYPDFIFSTLKIPRLSLRHWSPAPDTPNGRKIPFFFLYTFILHFIIIIFFFSLASFAFSFTLTSGVPPRVN